MAAGPARPGGRAASPNARVAIVTGELEKSGRLIEGLESRDGRWLVAVQCHPERSESTPDEFEGLWEAFVHAARDAMAEPAG